MLNVFLVPFFPPAIKSKWFESGGHERFSCLFKMTNTESAMRSQGSGLHVIHTGRGHPIGVMRNVLHGGEGTSLLQAGTSSPQSPVFHRLLFLPPVSPPRSPTTTGRRRRAASRCRPPCPARRRAAAARRRRAASMSCAAPTAAAKPACSTTTTRPAAASSPCWLTRWAGK